MPDNSLFVVTDFGAVADGATPATAAIQTALDRAAANGGGVVVVPPGRFRIGTLHLRSRVVLELRAGAVLHGSPDLADYPAMAWAADGDRQRHHLIVADGVEDAVICGDGTIDGNGPAFWYPESDPDAWIKAREPRVSPMVELRHCRSLRLEGIRLQNSGGWTVHLFQCDRVTVRGITLVDDLHGPNNDGFDINGCRDLVMSDCHIECCDDAIVLKASRDSRSCERITVTNCVIRTMCAALKLGTESWHDFRQITFSNCVVYRSSRAVALYSLDGGTIEDIAVSNIVCDTDCGLAMNRPIHLDLRRRPAKPGQIRAEHVGRIRNIMVNNLIARTDGRILLTAADGGVLERITLRDVQLLYPMVEDPEPLAEQVSSQQLSNATPDALRARAAVVAQGVRGLSVLGLQIAWPDEEETPAWHTGERRENGGNKRFPALKPGNVVPMHAVWARDIQGGIIDSPLAAASHHDVPTHHLENASMHMPGETVAH